MWDSLGNFSNLWQVKNGNIPQLIFLSCFCLPRVFAIFSNLKYNSLSTPGTAGSAVPRAAGPGEEEAHWTAQDEGHGQEATGGGAEEGDREIWAWKKGGDHRQE